MQIFTDQSNSSLKNGEPVNGGTSEKTLKLCWLILQYPPQDQILNKFLLLITLEASADVEERRGPIVLRGVSPSGLMQNMESHELFNNMPHDR